MKALEPEPKQFRMLGAGDKSFWMMEPKLDSEPEI